LSWNVYWLCIHRDWGDILEAVAGNVQLFMGGRFLIGLGVSFTNSAPPVYLVEVAFPQWRGLFGGLYYVFGYYTEAIGAKILT
jgi:MFS family permease